MSSTISQAGYICCNDARSRGNAINILTGNLYMLQQCYKQGNAINTLTGSHTDSAVLQSLFACLSHSF